MYTTNDAVAQNTDKIYRYLEEDEKEIVERSKSCCFLLRK
jgi:hypothetical protein